MGHNIAFDLLLLTCCGYALWKGGAPERITAAIFLAGVALTRFAASLGAQRWSSLEIGILLVDSAMLLALLAIALKADRFWPMWVVALHLLATAGHAVRLADPTVMRWGYAFALAFWSYPMLVILAGGTWCHQRRLARQGTDRSWSPSFGRSAGRRRAGPTG